MRISDGIEQYISCKRANGLVFGHAGGRLAAFSRYVGNIQLGQIKTQQVLAFLDAPVTSVVTWRQKYQTLFLFFEFLASRGAMPELLMPPQKPVVRTSFVPYIFTRTELRGLLKATIQNQEPFRSVDRQCLQALIILLYATGARIGETLNLMETDVDLSADTITMKRKVSNRSRRIPIGDDLHDVLRKYLEWRSRKKYRSGYLFATKLDSPITVSVANKHWQRLRRTAGLNCREGTQYQPRLDDLRCTFAVHRITSWIRNGADLNRMLPALAAYMGQMGLGATERYLFMTPERFRKALNKLSPAHSRNKWRNDPMLMKFLASL
jgi:integrase/recombinase XerD